MAINRLARPVRTDVRSPMDSWRSAAPPTLDQFLSRYGIVSSIYSQQDAFGKPRVPLIGGVSKIPVFAEGQFWDLPGTMNAKDFLELMQQYKAAMGAKPRIQGT